MYSRTNPRTERKVLFVFLSVVLFLFGLAVLNLQTVHVRTVRKRNEDNCAVVFEIEVFNPTEQIADATVCLAIGGRPNDSAGPWGAMYHHRSVTVLPGQTATVEVKFEGRHATLLGGQYSASVSSID